MSLRMFQDFVADGVTSEPTPAAAASIFTDGMIPSNLIYNDETLPDYSLNLVLSIAAKPDMDLQARR